MKRCDHCGKPIEGEALEIVPMSDSGARPTVYWHREREACSSRRPPIAEDSAIMRQLRRT